MRGRRAKWRSPAGTGRFASLTCWRISEFSEIWLLTEAFGSSIWGLSTGGADALSPGWPLFENRVLRGWAAWGNLGSPAGFGAFAVLGLEVSRSGAGAGTEEFALRDRGLTGGGFGCHESFEKLSKSHCRAVLPLIYGLSPTGQRLLAPVCVSNDR